MSALFSFRHLMAPQAGRLALTLLLALVTIVAGVALLGVSGWFITAAALAGAGAAFNLFAPSALVRGLSLIRILSRYGERLVGHDGTLRLLSDMRGWLFATLFPKLPLTRQSPRHGDVVSRMTADVDALNTAFLVIVSPMVAALAIWIGMTAVLAFLLPAASVAYALFFGAAILVVPAALVVASQRRGRAIAAGMADLRSGVLDAVEGHADLSVFGARGRAVTDFGDVASGLAGTRRALARLNALASASVQLLSGATIVALLWFGLAAHEAGNLPGALFVGLLLAALGSFEAAAGVVRGLAKFSTATASAERLRSLAEAEPRIVDPARPARLSGRFDLAFESVHFAHDGGAPVLRGVTFALPEGAMMALKGPSGSGKSTILQLALRLHDPCAGTVRLGGADLRTLAQTDLHRTVAFLDQSAPIFLDTIRANLTIADEGADDARLWQALERARIADFVRGLPRGLDTVLWEGGASLSAGQGRRLCLARTLLSPARIVVLDEPTSGLDRETELAFLNDIPAALDGRSVLLATHADIPQGLMRVYAVADGRVETGP
ncbi:thiol reductant ABC exporter subunit CydC [Aliihoeflea sp. PC F10.4]